MHPFVKESNPKNFRFKLFISLFTSIREYVCSIELNNKSLKQKVEKKSEDSVRIRSFGFLDSTILSLILEIFCLLKLKLFLMICNLLHFS